jgi:hypothetical protein
MHIEIASINGPLLSIQLVLCSFLSTSLLHGLDKLIVNHLFLTRIFNFFIPGQIKRLTGYTAKPQFLSQITVNVHLIFHFKDFCFFISLFSG